MPLNTVTEHLLHPDPGRCSVEYKSEFSVLSHNITRLTVHSVLMAGPVAPADGEVSDTAGTRSQRILNARPKALDLACE